MLQGQEFQNNEKHVRMVHENFINLWPIAWKGNSSD